MKKFAEAIVNKRILICILVAVITGTCAFFIPKVEINTDMTKYLSDDSQMKQGTDLMKKEFPKLEKLQTIRVMFTDLPQKKAASMKSDLEKIPHVDSVEYEAGSKDYNKKGKTLYVINTTYDYSSPEELAIEDTLDKDFDTYRMVYKVDDTRNTDLPIWIVAMAVGLLFLILFLMCGSWFEPILFLITIGAAVIINLGTNIFMGSISNLTFTIAAILQLVLSMDYSIILMNRYRQVLAETPDKYEAMKRALSGAFTSIGSSSMTTVVGLIMLVFMSYKIGLDLGIVLAKGVFISMLAVFTLLPALILFSHGIIQKTKKKVLPLKMGHIAGFSYRFRKIIPIVFVLLFAGAWVMQSHTDVSFTLKTEDPIAEVFSAKNTVVVLYKNDDDKAAVKIAAELQKNSHVKSAVTYSNTLGREYTQAEMINMMKTYGKDMNELKKLRDEAKAQLQGAEYSRMIVTTDYPSESAATNDFIGSLAKECDLQMEGNHYLIGDSVMNHEMENDFDSELLLITLLTAIAIFIVVAIAFRSLVIPALLVLVIQCGVYITISVIGLQGYSIYYMALLIVQCILMGATIDYGILFTNYYREMRRFMGVRETLTAAYNGSVHTILTSGLIMILVTGIISWFFEEPTVAQICRTISIGAVSATALILFILPGILACFDRLIAKLKFS